MLKKDEILILVYGVHKDKCSLEVEIKSSAEKYSLPTSEASTGLWGGPPGLPL
jgi:hypothetical protein